MPLRTPLCDHLALEVWATAMNVRRIALPVVAVAVVGSLITIVLTALTVMVHESNEERLLEQRTREAAAVLTATLPSVQTPLASAAELVAATDGSDAVAFENLMSPLVESRQPYVSSSIWRIDIDPPQPIMVVGEQPKLATEPAVFVSEYLQRSASTPLLGVIGLLDGDEPRIGYSFTSSRTPVRFVAYAEGALPPNRTSVVPSDNAFSGLDNAVYLGDREDPTQLLTASRSDLPLRDPRSSEVVEFGDSSLLLVMRPTGELGGGLMAALPWLVGVAGVLATLGATASSAIVSRGRNRAEALAQENARLYAEQRNVATTLQHSLLPQRLPTVAHVDIAARYIPGVAALDIGGDWYDAIELDPNRLLVVVGDVSGRGLGAGTAMASLRYAIRAFASRGDEPSKILTGLTELLDVDHDGHFATVLCATVDVRERTMTIVNAGHPSPLIVDEAGTRFLATEPGPPIGVTPHATYDPVTHHAAVGSTLLMFTDGLFERRGETIDAGLERLRSTIPEGGDGLDALLDGLVTTQISPDSHDDSAIIGVQWTTHQT